MANDTVLKENDADLEHADSDDNANERHFSDCAGRKKTQINILELIPDIFLKGYNLDDKDTEIINILFNSLLNGTDGVRAVDILKHFNEGKSDVVWEIKRLARLKQLEILKINGNQDDNTDSAGAMLRSTFKLSNDFLNLIYSEKDTADNITEYKDNFEYLSEQFERIRYLRETKKRFVGVQSSGNRKSDEEKLNIFEKTIADKLSKTDKTFFFEELKKKNNLDRKEELIILAMLENEIVHGEDRICIDEILDVISKTPYEKLNDRKLLQKDCKLFKKRIIETDSENHTIRGRRINSIRLNEKLKTKLLGEKRERRQKREKFKTNGFFEVVKPKVSLDKVILHPDTAEELNIAIEKVKGNAPNLLQKWGIKNNLLYNETNKRKKVGQSVVMLFHGPPGTGKTLAANAVAFKLKRELITFDCSKILSAWVGESEHNTRKIFDRYREISKGVRNPPALLLNEADQFLHRRINTVRSVDNMYNQMQNIFLEQIERFEGILIATTNLIENMDSAFSRRFHHKIEFRRPGSAERLKLWQVHIPERTPLADDVDLRHLSEQYDLSGGQIAVVIQNAATRAARRGDKIIMEDLINACDGEIKGNFDERAKLRVGF